jgi:ATP-binding cassette subfamily C (CFTR/MRP) protein 4
MIRFSITGFLPLVIQYLSECQVSVKRIEEFLVLPEIELGSSQTEQQELFSNIKDDSVKLAIENATFAWSKDGAPILKNITARFSSGLYIIVGAVGAGKSSFLQCILNDMFILNGVVALKSKQVAYVSQSPWIFSGTVKDNILFGKEFDEKRFNAVIGSCSLQRDLEIFPNGIDTFIGERGVTLSGGQRARVSLARAVYADADVYLLDDPLSAVDPKVGRTMFERCITGILADKVVILVTHQVQYLPDAKGIIVLEDGEISYQGDYDSFMQSKSDFVKSISKFAESKENVLPIQEAVAPADIAPVAPEPEPKDTKGFEKEEVALGGVNGKTYRKYLNAGIGPLMGIFLLFLFIGSQVFAILSDFWIANWTRESQEGQKSSIYPILFSIFISLAIILTTIRSVSFMVLCLRSSRNLFNRMLSAVFRAPMAFFQRNPHGRIMNRFSKDIALCDEMLPSTFLDLLHLIAFTIGVLVVMCVVIPWLLISVPFLMYAFLKLRNYYMATSRQVKRLEAITRSPVYTLIPSSLEGLSTIRAFGAKTQFKETFCNSQDTNTRMFFSFIVVSRWLGFRLDALVAFLITVVLILVISFQQALNLPSSLVGLLISYIFQLLGSLQWAVRQSAEVENYMVSTERICEYTELPSEAALQSEIELPANWPENGRVELRGLSLSYPSIDNAAKPGPMILKNISIIFEAGKRIGVVGRTGAGKSSLLQALFRIVEPLQNDSILIDGISTSKLGLRDLRSRISIIPQEPFCFNGTLRFNLDPFDNFTDEEIWHILETVTLRTKIESFPEKLQVTLAENGSDWSFGERQLVW